jgi:hypothetical protein
MPLTPGQTTSLRLRGVGIVATLQADAYHQVVGLASGAIHGVQTAGETLGELVPAVARVLTTAINTAPSGDWRNGLIGALEGRPGHQSKQTIAKCMVAADCCAQSPSTCTILPSEVTQSLVGGVLASDVEVFDSAGAWQPVPGGKQYNGFSVGLGFEAVRARF